MTNNEQRREFESISYDRAIQLLDQNENLPLSAEQLQMFLDESIDGGFTGRVVRIASLMNTQLTPEQLTRLIDRCLHFGELSDAIIASQRGPIPDETRGRLLQAIIANGGAADRQEAEEVLTSD